MAVLSAINIFPIKSLDAASVDACRVLPSGSLEYDRRFRLVDQSGQIVNGKRIPAVHRLRATFDLTKHLVRFTSPTGAAAFDLHHERDKLSCWLGDYFGFAVSLQEDTEHGFPDDLDFPGPTVISAASLAEVASWFPGLDLHETRRRFRANLEIAEVEPFWEDRLVGEVGRPIPFRIGGMEFVGMNPCQRCVVPSRFADTGEPTPAFTRTFSDRRQSLLPAWATESRFDHFYRLAVNTRLGSSQGGFLRVGDHVELLTRPIAT